MLYPVVPISIVNTPTDWTLITATFFAAFLGAAAAFGFNVLERGRTERQRRRDLINKSTYALSVTLNTLLNFKSQSLDKFNSEFDRLLEIVSETNTADPNAIAEAARLTDIVMNSVALQDKSLDGAFVLWQEIDFLELTTPEDLGFTIDGAPELVRLAMLARFEIKQISKRVIYRNSTHEKMRPSLFEESKQDTIGIDTLIFWQQMLKFRQIILGHTNVALVVIMESLDQLKTYREKKFKRRFFAKKKGWVEFTISEKYQPLLPNRADYKDIIVGVD